MRPVFLIGFMGAGKSTVGRLLAERLGASFVDLDDEIAASERTPVSEIFSTRGEAGFREAERRALERLAGCRDVVIACGGGVVTDAASRAVLERSGTIVYLRVSSEVALARVGGETAGRPLLRGGDPASASALLASREHLYESAATLTVETEGRTPSEIVEELVRRSEELRHGGS